MSKPLKMILGAERSLTAAELDRLNPGLVAALERARVDPRIVARASLIASISGLWRGHIPVISLRRRMYWPGALPCFAHHPRHMATLQHELQHVLEFATGELSFRDYLLRPRNWRYGYELELGRGFWDYGAEQRASMAEHLWLAENGHKSPSEGSALRLTIPWARPD
jgi:hypothetical protein